jgi:hypothetical protein
VAISCLDPILRYVPSFPLPSGELSLEPTLHPGFPPFPEATSSLQSTLSKGNPPPSFPLPIAEFSLTSLRLVPLFPVRGLLFWSSPSAPSPLSPSFASFATLKLTTSLPFPFPRSHPPLPAALFPSPALAASCRAGVYIMYSDVSQTSHPNTNSISVRRGCFPPWSGDDGGDGRFVLFFFGVFFLFCFFFVVFVFVFVCLFVLFCFVLFFVFCFVFLGIFWLAVF